MKTNSEISYKKGAIRALMAVAISFTIAVITSSGQSRDVRASNQKFSEKRFSVNFENTNIRDALALIAYQAGLRLDLAEDLDGAVSYSFANVTLRAALDQIAREKELSYQITTAGVLRISKGWAEPQTGRAVASVPQLSNGGAQMIRLKYLTTEDAMAKIKSLLDKEDKVIEDGPSNSLAFFGPPRRFEIISNALAMFDVMPQQILIEAHIVELNRQKSLEFGFSYGDLADPALGDVNSNSAVIKNNEPGSPNFAVQLGLGNIDGHTLAARLAAAEGEGDAKILSRPKVVTINNKAANITSGISYSIRTLAAVSVGGQGDTADSGVTSGVTQVSAGLNLSVTPTVVGDGKIKLLINVSNSEPDETTKIDGIPGIISNSTNTEIIVGHGKTASVAGLIKNTFAENETGVPLLSKIPLLGWLFKSYTKSNRDKELMVFITPRIVDKELENQNLEAVAEAFPEVKLNEASLSEEPVKSAEPAESAKNQ